jgi:hypothetical protein
VTSTVPIFVGSPRTRTATQLAEAALEAIASLSKRSRQGRPRFYEVGMDLSGRIVVDRMDSTPPAELLMVCNWKSDPDELADNIRAEVEARNCDGRKAA